MTVKVLVDTNVLLDVLAKRQPFYAEALRVWTLAETERIDAHIAAISFTNCYYLVARYGDRRSADKAVRLLRDTFGTIDLTARIVDQAIDAEFEDFEDAVQFHSAAHAGVDCIITRNPDDFPKSPISILTPAEFLAIYKFE